jgi:hypothetical protein
MSPNIVRRMIVSDFKKLMDEMKDDTQVNVPQKKARTNKTSADVLNHSSCEVVSHVSMDDSETVAEHKTGENDSRTRVARTRAIAQAERKGFREQIGLKMMKQQDADVLKRSAKVGSILSLAMPKKDEAHGRGLIGIAFAVSKHGGCCVATKHGIIGSGKRLGWIPVDRYKVLPDDVPIDEDLVKLHDLILKDELGTLIQNNITLRTAFRLEYETTRKGDQATPKDDEDKVVACKCTKGCTTRCKCFKNKSACGQRCRCKGLCENNNKKYSE